MKAIPAQPPSLNDERLAQMRAHLLDEIDRDARRRERRARVRSRVPVRRMLVVVTAALAVTFSVPAVAEERWWWEDAGPELQPQTQVLTLGRWTTRDLSIRTMKGKAPTAGFGADGQQWTVQIFLNVRGDLCIGISPEPRRPANEGASVGCGSPVYGLPLSYEPDELHWVGFGAFIPGMVTDVAPKFMLGPAADRVRTIDLENHNNGRVLRVETHAVPKELGIRARFWIVILPVDHLVHVIVPRDEDGKALEHWRLPTAQ